MLLAPEPAPAQADPKRQPRPAGNPPLPHSGPWGLPRSGGVGKGALTKAGKSSLVGGEAHPTKYGLAGGARARGLGAQVQGAPSVQSSQVGPGGGVRKPAISGSTHAP